ncbi:unnamed protein product [Lactuca virosa]|uniref:CHASE domain-containing protein n=1 Tax=Lactuca virosa TaxID=75947 RepID=A0AAU9P3K0_9ASTR|nr:unnamed protein product [Lactuca virosa]
MERKSLKLHFRYLYFCLCVDHRLGLYNFRSFPPRPYPISSIERRIEMQQRYRRHFYLMPLPIYVPTNPQGAEQLPPAIVVTETDYYLRKLWGAPLEGLKKKLRCRASRENRRGFSEYVLGVLVSTFHYYTNPSVIDQQTFAEYTARTAFERPLLSGVAYAQRVMNYEREDL